MKIVVIGSTGCVGRNICSLIERHHFIYSSSSLELVGVSRSSAIAMDALNEDSVKHGFKVLDNFDALVLCFGETIWSSNPHLDEISTSIKNKALAQIRCAMTALPHLNSGGSITFFSGIVGSVPTPAGLASATANAVLEMFAKCWDEPFHKGIRINAVRSPLLMEACHESGNRFPGQPILPAEVALAPALRAIYGVEDRQVLSIYDGLMTS